MRAEFDIGNGKRNSGEVVRVNESSVLVKMKSGRIIKRHKEKHNVEMKGKK